MLIAILLWFTIGLLAAVGLAHAGEVFRDEVNVGDLALFTVLVAGGPVGLIACYFGVSHGHRVLWRRKGACVPVFFLTSIK